MAREHDVSGLPALIRASVIIFDSSVICAFGSENIFIILLYNFSHESANTVRKLDGNFTLGCGHGTDYP